MVTVYRGASWKLSVYGREHGIPHFHIEGPDYRCSIGIEAMTVIIGGAPKRILDEALVWARANRHELMKAWRELN